MNRAQVTGFQLDKVVGKGPGQVLGFVVGERLWQSGKAGRSVPTCWECSLACDCVFIDSRRNGVTQETLKHKN